MKKRAAMFMVTAALASASAVALAAQGATSKNPASHMPASAGQASAAMHTKWMDDAAELQEDLKDALKAKSGPKAATAAVKIAGLMAQTQAYWAAKKESDIVKLAQESQGFARQVAAAARAGKLDDASAAATRMDATCSACHELHPEKRPAA